LTRPRKIQPPAPAKPTNGRDLPVRPSRRIVVRPEEVFPTEPARIPRRSFEGAVARYVLMSAAVVIGLSIFALVATALVGH
jgi:hypothetical protein